MRRSFHTGRARTDEVTGRGRCHSHRKAEWQFAGRCRKLPVSIVVKARAGGRPLDKEIAMRFM
ncbi:MAG: hypothetical protein ACXWC6_06400, partial [Ramlibacter sp.]